MNVYKNDLDETVRLRIEPHIGIEGIYLELKENGNRATTVFPPKDAPALALAILEAAGYTEDDTEVGPRKNLVATDYSLGMRYLRFGIEEQLRKSQANKEAEAKDKAELEAEALDFCNAHREALDLGRIRDFREMVGAGYDGPWLAVARAAREMAEKRTEK